MGNVLPGSHRHRGFGHGHGPFGGPNTGPFGGQQRPRLFSGPPGPGQSRAYVQDPLNPHYGVNYGQGVGPQNQYPGQPPVANVTPPPYNQGNYPPQGYPQQGHYQGFPQGQNYPGYGPGYPQPGYHGPGYPPPATPGAAMGQAACCASCMACLTCLLCSCCPGMGDGIGDNIGEDGNEVPGTANVTSPRDADEH